METMEPAEIVTHTPRVRQLLLSALKSNGTVAYGALYALFDEFEDSDFGGENLRMAAIHFTLEAAGRELADPKNDAIATVVMARKADKLPGIGFFNVYKTLRPTEYALIAGKTILQELTDQQKQQMASQERARAYAFANDWL